MYDFVTDTDKKERLIELLSDVLGPVRSHYSNKSQIAFDCPQCSSDKGLNFDGKGNLEINYRKGKFNCWSCGEQTGMRGSLPILFKRWFDKDHQRVFNSLKLQFSYQSQGETIIKPVAKLKLPVEYVSLANAPDVGLNKNYLTYLRSRGVTPEMIEKFNIGCAFTGKYAARVVLPSYDEDGDLNYFVTRAISPRVKKLKYLNAEVPKETIIFNERFIDWEKPVFIVEGPFDHIVVPNSIPLLGKKMSDLLFKTLYENVENKIILILDPDAWERTVQLYNKLDGGKLMGKVYATKMPEDIDLSKYNELYGQEALFTHIRKNTIRIIE